MLIEPANKKTQHSVKLKKKSNIYVRLIVLIICVCTALFIYELNYPYAGLLKHQSAEKPSYPTILYNYVSSKFSSIDEISIHIKPKHYQKLKNDIEHALELGYRECKKDCFVPAKLSINGETAFSTKIRLKGLLPHHFDTDKFSLRVKIKDDNSHLWGMKNFSLQSPHTRGWSFEPLFMDHLRKEGLLGLKYKFVNLKINNKDIGVMAVEEAISKELFESQHRRNGVGFKFDADSGFIPYYINNLTLYNSKRMPASAIQKKKIMKSPALGKHIIAGKQMLKAFQRGTMEASEIFDVDKVAKFIAITELWSAWHPLQWDDIRFYLNPITMKFEIIGSDVKLHMNHFNNGPLFDYSIGKNATSHLFLSDKKIKNAFIEEIHRITKPEYINELIKLTKDNERKYLSKLHKDYPALPLFNPEHLKNKAKNLSSLNKDNIDSFIWSFIEEPKTSLNCINPEVVKNYPEDIFPIDMNVYVNRTKEDSFLELNNTLFSPDSCVMSFLPVSKTLKITNIELKNGIFVTDETQYPIMLEPEGKSAIVKIKIPDKLLNSKKKVKGYAKIEGQDEPFYFKAKPYVEALTSPILAPQDINIILRKYPFIKIRNDNFYIVKGNHKITSPIILPKNLGLNIEAGAIINFATDAFILSQGSFNSNGTEKEPIILQGQKGKKWKGLAIIESKEPSKIIHTKIRDLDYTESNIWKLTGGITFYESAVEIKNSTFSNVVSEDALNIVRSDFNIENTKFVNTRSDALDSDFSNGEIIGSNFIGIGGDAIDTSGSKIVIENVAIKNVGDKAISVGEKSNVKANNLNINTANIAVASKDGSKVKIRNSLISNIRKTALSSYIKKVEYGSYSEIIAENIKFGDNIRKRNNAQKGTFLSIDGIDLSSQ